MTDPKTARKVGKTPGAAASSSARPTQAQRRWLARGADQSGGKLPLFDGEGRAVPQATIRACIDAGWAEPWFANPVKPDWLVCKLTDNGYAVIGRDGGRRPR
jgi:hypothetical protein